MRTVTYKRISTAHQDIENQSNSIDREGSISYLKVLDV